MSVRISQETEAQRVAEHTSARDYFLGEEEKAIEEWAERARKIFEYAIENLDLPGTFWRANTKWSRKFSWRSTPMTSKNCITKAERSLRLIAFLIEK